MPPDALAAESPAGLVGRIRAGESSAEAELVNRYRRGLAFILARATSDRPAIDDLLQDAFRIALEKIRKGDLREPEKLSGFLCGLARNLAIEHFRKGAARRAATSAGGEALIRRPPDPQERALQAERLAIVRQVLSELGSDRDRQILYRFYIAEDEKDAICRDLHLSSLHFNRVLFRARERYRALYLKRIETDAREPR